jgi:hypothetical protein
MSPRPPTDRFFGRASELAALERRAGELLVLDGTDAAGDLSPSALKRS